MQDVERPAPLWDDGLLVEADVCPLSGRRAGAACPGSAPRRFPRDRLPEVDCDVHVHASPRSLPRAGAYPGVPLRCDPAGERAIVILPEVFDEWLAERPPGAPGRDGAGLPWFARSHVAGCAEDRSVIEFLHVDAPPAGAVLPEEGEIQVSASAIGADGPSRITGVEIVVDGELVARSAWPFRASVPARRGDHEILVRPIDPRARARVAMSRFSVR
jgi:penicillin-binding protein 1C